MSLHSELADLLRANNRESDCNTPDFILANFMLGCLDVFNSAVEERDEYKSYPDYPIGGAE